MPQQPAAGQPRASAAGAHLLGDRAQPRPIGGGPGPARVVAVARLGEEPVEHLVDEAAAIDRRELHDVFRALDRLDVQHVLHEVRVRALRPTVCSCVGDVMRPVGSEG